MKWQLGTYISEVSHSDGWLYFWKESDSKGKYLFFSQDPFELLSLGMEIIAKYPWLTSWKVSEPIGDEDCVLCVFSQEKNPQYDKEFREDLKDATDIRYRWWKSHKDTMEGKYSNM
jgi:hypothetical protein